MKFFFDQCSIQKGAGYCYVDFSDGERKKGECFFTALKILEKMEFRTKVYFSQEKPKMIGILPFQPQVLMVLKFLNFAQKVALMKKPVQTLSILAFQTNICELIEYFVRKLARGKNGRTPFIFGPSRRKCTLVNAAWRANVLQKQSQIDMLPIFNTR